MLLSLSMGHFMVGYQSWATFSVLFLVWEQTVTNPPPPTNTIEHTLCITRLYHRNPHKKEWLLNGLILKWRDDQQMVVEMYTQKKFLKYLIFFSPSKSLSCIRGYISHLLTKKKGLRQFSLVPALRVFHFSFPARQEEKSFVSIGKENPHCQQAF